MSDLFDAKIALFHQHAESRDEALKMLADEFIKAGVAKETFYEGLIRSEFPDRFEPQQYVCRHPSYRY